MENKIQPIIPINPAGIEDVAEALSAPEPETSPETHFDFNVEQDDIKRFEQIGLTPKEVIVLPAQLGNYAYPALGISMYRLGESDKLKQVTQALGISYTNTEQERTSRKNYIGNVNWFNALKINLSLGGLTLPLREFKDFYNLLKNGKAGTTEVKNLEGQRVSRDKLAEILEEIAKIREPWRAEWLDADFNFLDADGKLDKIKQGKFYLLTKHVLKNGVLVPSHKVELVDADYISSQDCKVNASKFTSYGLPTEQGNDFSYWYPRKDNNSVARFNANSGGAGLYCSRDPAVAYASLGVRYASPIGRASLKI